MGLVKQQKILYNDLQTLSIKREYRANQPVTEETMEQKAKRFGKFNVVDIIAVLLILAVIAFAGYKFVSGRNAAAEAPPRIPVTFQVKVEGVPAELYESCVEHLPSPLMASGALVGGNIESVEKEPFLVISPDGEWVEDPAHVNLIFTATTTVLDTPVMLTKVGDQEIRVGKPHLIKSEYIEFQGGIITDVQWGE